MPDEPLSVKQILVPTDFSECAGQALEWAILHGRAFGAAITVLHVVERHIHLSSVGLAEGSPADEVVESQERLRAFIDERLAGRGVQAAVEVCVGEPAIEIREAASRLGADLIVMGTHGRNRLADLLFGSVAERVIHHSGCPVLAVPPRREVE